MVDNHQHITYYTNIIPKKTSKTPQIKKLNSSMIIKKELVKTTKKRDGTIQPVYDFKLNSEFWKKLKGVPKSVVLDEFHNIMDARRSMSKQNIIMGDFIALLRRIVGDDPEAEGDLIIITQLGRRADSIARDMAHQVRYHTCHYIKTCKKCSARWKENSEMPEQKKTCPRCGYWRLTKSDHLIEVLCFNSVSSFDLWKDWGAKSYYKKYFVRNVNEYFGYYDTLQWDNLLSDIY